MWHSDVVVVFPISIFPPFQLTFFSPVLAWAAEMEERGTHSLFFCKAIQASETSESHFPFMKYFKIRKCALIILKYYPDMGDTVHNVDKRRNAKFA